MAFSSSPSISKTDVVKAAGELASMRRALAGWLKYRTLNDKVLDGTITHIKKPLPYAQRVIASSRDLAIEQDLATKLSVLLGEVMPDAQLPSPDLSQNPQAAVQLANIALVGASPMAQSSPAAQGALFGGTHPYLWPVLIVGGLLLAITTAIKSSADVAKDKEEKACIEAGACTDFGFWLKAGGIAALVFVAWNQFGIGDLVKSHIKRRT